MSLDGCVFGKMPVGREKRRLKLQLKFVENRILVVDISTHCTGAVHEACLTVQNVHYRKG
jgi:hypothetical protein